MKITSKTTKEQLKSFLGANASLVKKKDKDLFDQLTYADKMMKTDEKKVTKKDLSDLVKLVMTLLGDKCKEPALAETTPVAENSVKTPKKKLSSKLKNEETKKEEVDKKEEVAKKAPKKSLGNKSKDGDADCTNVTAQAFPDTLDVFDSHYEIAHDIKSMEDLYKELEEKENEILFAFYYSKQMLKKGPYFFDMLGHPKSFENDLDLATTIYVSNDYKVAYHISAYTEGCYNTLPEDFEEVDGVRYAGGMEFQIYRAV